MSIYAKSVNKINNFSSLYKIHIHENILKLTNQECITTGKLFKKKNCLKCLENH